MPSWLMTVFGFLSAACTSLLGLGVVVDPVAATIITAIGAGSAAALGKSHPGTQEK